MRLNRRTAWTCAGLVLLLALMLTVMMWRKVRKAQMNSELFNAIQRDDAKKVVQLLRLGAGPNARISPPVAGSLWQLMLQSLLGRGRTGKGPTRRTALQQCIFEIGDRYAGDKKDNECVQIVSCLLKSGAEPNAPVPIDDLRWNVSPLYDSCSLGDPEIVQLLLQYGARTDVHNRDGTIPLHRAVWQDRPEVVALLLAAHAKPNAMDNLGEIPLHQAYRSPECLPLLLANCADINAKNRFGETPLIVFVKHYRSGVEWDWDVKRSLLPLLDAHPNVNILDNTGHSALYYARREHLKFVIRKLLNAEAKE